MRPAVLTGEHFMLGDTACAEGAIAAGCRFFAGYPITPATEIAERMAERLPEVCGVYIQMEDELASMASIIGASCGGMKSMTSTSGPGFSLMQENIGLAIMMEVPCVIADVQRGSPSTGLPTLVGQSDVMQTRWGSHGDYEIVAYAPYSVQEMFDLTVKAFNTSEKYRIPVVILTDEVVGHLTEKLVIPPEDELHLVYRKLPDVPPERYRPYEADDSLIPPMALAGEGYFIHMTGLTHDEMGYPIITGEAHEKLVRRLIEKIRKHRHEIIEYEEIMTDDAEIVVVSYGITARSALSSVRKARSKGLKVGLLRLITVWSFPEERVKELSEKVDFFVVAEINQGQIRRELERWVDSVERVVGVHKLGGDLITPENILEAIWQPLRR